MRRRLATVAGTLLQAQQPYAAAASQVRIPEHMLNSAVAAREQCDQTHTLSRPHKSLAPSTTRAIHNRPPPPPQPCASSQSCPAPKRSQLQAAVGLHCGRGCRRLQLSTWQLSLIHRRGQRVTLAQPTPPPPPPPAAAAAAAAAATQIHSTPPPSSPPPSRAWQLPSAWRRSAQPPPPPGSLLPASRPTGTGWTGAGATSGGAFSGRIGG